MATTIGRMKYSILGTKSQGQGLQIVFKCTNVCKQKTPYLKGERKDVKHSWYLEQRQDECPTELP